MSKSIIKLPITQNYLPDWDSIEQYMSKMEERVNNKLLLINEILSIE